MKNNAIIVHDTSRDGIDRRGFLKCMGWAGTAVVCSISGGILTSRALGDALANPGAIAGAELSFVQISDSHIGFNKAANTDVIGTFQAAVDKINAMPVQPAFILHTGDLTQLAQADQFDTVDQILKGARTQTGQVFYVPGEHDVVGDGGKLFLDRYGKGTKGGGWYSFDKNGIHFIGLVNVLNLGPHGLGDLGDEQLAWLKDDVRGLSHETPIVVFAHIPLWEVYPAWGWGTDDSEQALALLKRFGSVTVLNGHIHQTMQKVEGNVVFHTALSTAFPQGEPGKGSPGPLRDVPADKLRSVLGLSRVSYVASNSSLAIADPTLE